MLQVVLHAFLCHFRPIFRCCDSNCLPVGVTKLVGDFDCCRRTFDKLNDTLEDIDSVISKSETSLSDISQSSSLTESQRLHRLQASLSHLLSMLVSN